MCDCGSTDIALAFKCMHAMCLGCYEQSCEESKSVVVDGHSVKLIRCPKCQMFDLVTMDEMIGMIKNLHNLSVVQKDRDIHELHDLIAQKVQDNQDLHETIAQKECELHRMYIIVKESNW